MVILQDREMPLERHNQFQQTLKIVSFPDYKSRVQFIICELYINKVILKLHTYSFFKI